MTLRVIYPAPISPGISDR